MQIIVHKMKAILSIIALPLICGSGSFANSGTARYGYADSVAVAKATEAVDSLDYIDRSLHEIIKQRDLPRLVSDREQALSVLENLPPDAYGINEKPTVRRLLASKSMRLTNQELSAYKRVRSVQVNNMGIFSYPYFSCRFKWQDGKLFFEKTSGSQRKSGYVYDNNPYSKVFLGGWSVNNDPQTTYDSENSVSGMIYKIGANKIIMVFPSHDERSFEIYELTKQR